MLWLKAADKPTGALIMSFPSSQIGSQHQVALLTACPVNLQKDRNKGRSNEGHIKANEPREIPRAWWSQRFACQSAEQKQRESIHRCFTVGPFVLLIWFLSYSYIIVSGCYREQREVGEREGRGEERRQAFLSLEKHFLSTGKKSKINLPSQPSENGLQTSRPVHPCGALLSPTSLLALFTPGISSVPQFIFFLHLKMWWTPLTDGDAVKCAKHPRMKSVHGQKLHLYVFNSHDTKQQLVSPWWSLYHTSALSETSYLQDLIGI